MKGDDQIRMKASEVLEKIREAMPPRKMHYGTEFTQRQFDKVWKAIESCESGQSKTYHNQPFN